MYKIYLSNELGGESEKMKKRLLLFSTLILTVVLLLTADDNMRVHARNFRLSSQLLVIPHEVPRTLPADQWGMANILYDLAIHFGIIRLSGLGIILLGEWMGKSVQDYLDEKVKIIVDKGSSIGDDLMRDISIVDGWRTIEGRVSRL